MASPDAADQQQAHYARIHRRMQQFLKQNPQVLKQHRIVKGEDNVYEVDGKRVRLDWHGQPGRVGRLLVVDGPLRQPLPDYLAMGEANAEYDTSGVEKTSSLHHVPKDRRLTFNDDHTRYSRLDSMKVAKEQAAFREKAAAYVKEGRVVPGELHRSYDRCLQQKLRSGRHGSCLRQRTSRDESREPPQEGDRAGRPKDSAGDSRSSSGAGAAGPGGDGSQACDWDGPGQESPTLQTRISRSVSGRMLPAPPAAPRALQAPPRQVQATPHRHAQAALAAPAGALAAGACCGGAAAPPPFAVSSQHGAIALAHARQQKSLAAAAVAAVSVGACHRGGARGGACGGA